MVTKCVISMPTSSSRDALYNFTNGRQPTKFRVDEMPLQEILIKLLPL
jgi:hypothetical protein